MKELILPKFLLAEEPTKPIDREVYIYSPHYLSLVLIIPEDDITLFLNEEKRTKPRKTFTYQDESFELVVLQNNVGLAGGNLSPEITEDEFLNQAWMFWEDYLIWEDSNSDESEISQLN
ncbi:hypothetical protein MKJ01_05370 [Chryseobacterium sp. SSA4.19]|uniref:hypothetical protein n=1 Tax=Chryseobacterium sp. SSA4.19 TaxID=2919915 RepID=UPI001F4DA117|nr:hypothetical protein [Chryseobacterium sp. SSA4.19]MCJ8153190.1 hypothetical protein [Chryseobacterium sp. SSA4.19]